MRVDISFELDDSIIREAAVHALSVSFARPDYRGQIGHDGWERVRAAVRDYVAELDLRDYVHAAAGPILEEVVRDVIAETVRRRVRQVVRTEEQDGSLLDSVKPRP